MSYSLSIGREVILLSQNIIDGTNLKTMINIQEVFNTKIIDYIQNKCKLSFPCTYDKKQTLLRINISLNILNYLYNNSICEYSLSLDKYFSSEFVETIMYDIRLFQRYYVLSLLVDLLDVDKRILYENECVRCKT